MNPLPNRATARPTVNPASSMTTSKAWLAIPNVHHAHFAIHTDERQPYCAPIAYVNTETSKAHTARPPMARLEIHVPM